MFMWGVGILVGRDGPGGDGTRRRWGPTIRPGCGRHDRGSRQRRGVPSGRRPGRPRRGGSSWGRLHHSTRRAAVKRPPCGRTAACRPALDFACGSPARRRDHGRPRHHDARHRPHRRLLHQHAARPAQSRPGQGRLFAQRRPRAAFSERWGIPEHTDDLAAAINHPDTDVVVVALPNHLHEEAVDAGRGGRQVGPLHQAAGPDGGRGRADARRRSSGPASSPATSRTSATRPRRSRRSPRCRPAPSAT